MNDYVNDLIAASGEERKEDQATFDDLWSRVTYNASLWKSIRPRPIEDSSKWVVMKAFGAMEENVSGNGGVISTPLEPEKLPYEPVKAPAAHDMWGIGMLLFRMFSKRDLFQTTSDGNIVSDEDVVSVARWNEESGMKNITAESISDPVLRDLLRHLISTSDKRYSSVSEVLSHPYFDDDAIEEADLLHQQVVHAEFIFETGDSEIHSSHEGAQGVVEAYNENAEVCVNRYTLEDDSKY